VHKQTDFEWDGDCEWWKWKRKRPIIVSRIETPIYRIQSWNHGHQCGIICSTLIKSEPSSYAPQTYAVGWVSINGGWSVRLLLGNIWRLHLNRLTVTLFLWHQIMHVEQWSPHIRQCYHRLRHSTRSFGFISRRGAIPRIQFRAAWSH
jgi:hypothetical protein